MMKNWYDLTYLLSGNSRQQNAYRLISETNIFTVLQDFNPVLTGTIPIGIDIPGSDLDIICNCKDLDKFRQIVNNNFKLYRNFTDAMADTTYIANFIYSGTEFEIYAQEQDTFHQNAYRHMLIEDRILHIAGDSFRKEIIRLKTEGYKTEPAFGKLLNLTEPYRELLILESLTDKEIREIIHTNQSIS